MKLPNPNNIIRDAAVLMLLFVGIWFGVAELVPKEWGYKPQLPVDDEVKIGKLLLESYLVDVETVEDTLAKEMIDNIAERLQEKITNSKYTYNFVIVKNDQPNAFTLPGGNIVIFTGLINEADSPEEIAGVIAHEMGHAENRHVIDRLIKQFGLTVIAALVLGDNGTILGQVLQHALSTSFDREQEREADDFALRTMVKAKISPTYLADFFEKIDKYSQGLDKTLEFMSTHPDNEERIEKARKYPVPTNFKNKPFAEEEVDLEALKMAIEGE